MNTEKGIQYTQDGQIPDGLLLVALMHTPTGMSLHMLDVWRHWNYRIHSVQKDSSLAESRMWKNVDR